jgi:hypothetical protein
MTLTAVLIFSLTQSPQGTPGCTYGRFGSCPARPGIGLPVFLLEAVFLFGGLLLVVLSKRLSGETENPDKKPGFEKGIIWRASPNVETQRNHPDTEQNPIFAKFLRGRNPLISPPSREFYAWRLVTYMFRGHTLAIGRTTSTD